MEKKKLIILILAISLCFPAFVFAETIVLKSGQTVEGSLIERTDEYIKIDFQGVPLTYFFDEIKSIDGNPVISAPVKVRPEQAATEYKKSDEISSGAGEEEKTVEMILEKKKNARANIRTARMKGTDILGNEVGNFEAEMDFANKALAMTAEKDGQISRTYIKDGVTYMQVLGKWMKLEGEMNVLGNMLDKERWANIIPQDYKESGFSFTLKGEEVVEGRPCYVLYSTIIDKAKVKEYLRAAPDKFIPADVAAKMKNNPAFEDMIELLTQKMEYTEWIDKDTFYNIRTLTKTLDKNKEGQVVPREKENTFYDINKPLNIEVPAEALQAKELATVTSYVNTLDRGKEYYKQGRYDEAITEFNKASLMNPNDSEAYGVRGASYFKKGNLDQAISDCTKAIELNPNYALAYCSRGLAYFKKGNLDQAISDCTKAIELNPNYADAYFGRGLAYAGQGNLDQAISDFNKAISINPNLAEAYGGRAFAYYSKKDYDKAWQDVHRAEALGLKIPKLLELLKKASGREN